MAEVALNSPQFLSDDGLNAMAIYLKSLTGPATMHQTAPAAPDTKPVHHDEVSGSASGPGAKLDDTHCAQCHGDRGEGIKGAYAPRARNRVVTMTDTTHLIQIVLHGGYTSATAGNPLNTPPIVRVFLPGVQKKGCRGQIIKRGSLDSDGGPSNSGARNGKRSTKQQDGEKAEERHGAAKAGVARRGASHRDHRGASARQAEERPNARFVKSA